MRTGGFTLVELVVTLAILALLASMAVPLGMLVVQRHKEAELRGALRDIRTAIDAYKKAWDEGRIEAVKSVDASGYPPTLDVLWQGVPDAKDPNGRTLYFLRRLPRDPFYPDPATPAAQTWGLRSYASPPEAPQAGADVFDVYSLTPGVGLNGTPYRDW